MSAILQHIFSIVALILMGVFATFLVALNIADDEQQKKENEDGKINKQDLL